MKAVLALVVAALLCAVAVAKYAPVRLPFSVALDNYIILTPLGAWRCECSV